ncbi:asparagine synthase (glutamine-hydrolyzing) [Schinkia azotoformans]|uniref:asparagine synthase (glutamine-hydrolyzing) n=1 Tax=Schinkia azotoformans LMG 9581 TaxID=1131731 RepID=K6DJS6_SCHAZ|nr:asparagine synthase (glutamine-hydrolyzing) [Schinkia azotoformans]EKN68544.1 asparagine synthase [Schinkia azotoformans LMG 9581]MEC1640756.1 asparagine synthase (glutamine-hydrolyzing) [Schinkia azotoformans]MEC1945242.1 asparagine synthase (glutamine-hydrolyzing) [Schinkia azotoformans]
MCGFVGALQPHPDVLKINEFMSMNHTIYHRGPDDEGYYIEDNILMGFRRLSIIDLEGGHQPMSYNNQKYWIVFNGEIYNFIELRDELILDGYNFQTGSDTEVILALYQKMGQDVVDKLRGMFAFVIYDKVNQLIFGARDHFGIKPFFYLEEEHGFYFASEKKSILKTIKDVNVDALQHYFTFQFVPEPLTLSGNIKKLEPGHCFIKRIGAPIIIKKYWNATFEPKHYTKEQLIKKVRDVLFDSVEMHMRSDVPVGSFLSGGIDSSSIVSIAKELNPSLLTFSVGFEQQGYSEIDVAKETAASLNVTNIHFYISPEEYVRELPKIVWHMDDPLADPAAIPLYFVAREARKYVKVVLSGEGADELFGGYNIYREPNSLRYFSYIPPFMKKLMKKSISVLADGTKGKNFVIRGCTPLEERYIGNAKMFDELEKQHFLKTYNSSIKYHQIISPLYDHVLNYDLVSKMQYIDIHTWLRGDILLKADRMTMAHSIELRVPFLDKEVFQVASEIVPSMKIANQTTKYILREALKDIVPEHVLHRRKLGFPVPIRVWLKNELYDWAVNIIQTSQTDEWIDKQYILSLLEDHCRGKADYSRKIWTVLIFMIWHQVFIEKIYDFDAKTDEIKEMDEVLV